jgi:hypothetical protein
VEPLAPAATAKHERSSGNERDRTGRGGAIDFGSRNKAPEGCGCDPEEQQARVDVFHFTTSDMVNRRE